MNTILNFLRKWFPQYQRPENSGIILGNLPTDYFAGVNSPIPYQIRLQNGNWTPYAFDLENQFSRKGDALDCVAESFINSIEAQEFFITGKKIQYSKRWLAKVSGTNQGALKGKGNSYTTVADVIHNIGLVLEEHYPKPEGDWTTDEFYQPIPEPLNTQLLEEAGKWKEKWSYNYEFLNVNDANLDYHLKHSPINVVIPGHSICGIYSPDQLMQYLDSYPNYFKSTPVSGLVAAMKGILTPKNLQAFFMKFIDNPTVYLMAEIDSMQSLENFKTSFPVNYPKYLIREGITTLPIKKP